MVHENVFENAGRLFFTRDQVKGLEVELNTAGINMPADSFAGYVTINVIVITIILSLILILYQPAGDLITNTIKGFITLPGPVIGLLLIIAAFVFVYLATMSLLSTYLIMKTDERRSKLEFALPDFLTLVASNIKAGMALDQAMWYSAKPEFGLLSNEVKSTVKGSFSGESLEASLDRLSKRFDSKVFKRTILLLKQASATGGELTMVLEKTTEDVRNTLIMRKEISASLIMYEIFVLFAAVVGTPFLFAVALKLIEIFEKISPQASGGAGALSTSGGALGSFAKLTVGSPIISSSEFFWFTVPTIFVTALVSSFIVSVIRTGSKGHAIKYFPFVLILSYLAYWIVISTIGAFFSSIA